MQPTLFFLFCLIGTVLSRYPFQDKTRFDRSIPSAAAEETAAEKQWFFTDEETYFAAYKDRHENNCYLENLTHDRAGNFGNARPNRQAKVLYAPNLSLTKIEAWRIAGGRIVEFCTGRNIILLQDTKPTPTETVDPFYNLVPIDENDIVTKRVADVVLTPLLSRAKRQVMLEEREKLNQEVALNRHRRQAPQFRGRFRGQTQSQYLNTDGSSDKDGKAEAEATQQSSRAIVSGSRGMGQAQSMSMGGTGCEDCPGSPGYLSGEAAPDRLRLQQPLREDKRYSYGSDTSVSGRPVGVQSTGGPYYSKIPGVSGTGTRTPQEIPGTIGPTWSGTVPSQPGVIPNGLTRPGTIPTGTGQTDSQGYRQGVSMVPIMSGREGVTYSNGVQPGSTFPSGVYPGRQPGETVVYPGGTVNGVLPGSGTYPGSVSPGTTQTRGDGTHIGVPHTTTHTVIPQTGGTYPQTSGIITPEGKTVYPGSFTPDQGRTYPGVPGTQVTYPGSMVPESGISYPGGMVPESGISYPGGMVPGSGTVYPGGNLPDSGSLYYGNVQPGTVRPGRPVDGTQTTRVEDKSSTYPHGVPTSGTGAGTVYSDRQPTGPNVMTEREKISYPGVYQPGTITPGSGVPGTMVPGGQATYPSGIPTTHVQPGGTGMYTGTSGTGAVTGTGVPTGSGTRTGYYPTGTSDGTVSSGISQGRVQPGGMVPGHYPTATIPGTMPTGTGSVGTGTIPIGTKVTGDTSYPSGLQPGSIGMYPGVVHHGRTDTVGGPGPNIYTTTGSTEGGRLQNYPGATMPNMGQMYPGVVAQPGVAQDGQVGQGKGLYPGSAGIGTRGTEVMYPSDRSGQMPYFTGTQTGPSTNGVYPGGTGANQIPGYITRQYPSGIPGIPGSQYPTDVGGTVQMTDAGRQQFGQYPASGGIAPGQDIGARQYPASGGIAPGQDIGARQYPALQYPRGSGIPGSTGEVSQYYRQSEQGGPSTVLEGDDANADSQASSSVKQVDAGTQASASAQGKYGQGTAQSQVMGTYSGSGSFMAQAGTSDVNKNVQTEVSGGKEGAISSAQGVGGYGKSQTQVQLDSESGATSTGAQSSGWNHGTNSQVQASSKGGMADAQANGEGNTSSQAQIGFQPYQKTDENVERHAKPFRGGGSASAQSGTYRGQSQSQLEGSFQYGITYTGAAQAGSGSGAVASRKPFNFNITDTEVFKPFRPYSPPVISKDVESETTTEKAITDMERNQDDLQASSSSRKAAATNEAKKNTQNSTHKKPHSSNKPRMEDSVYDTNTDYDEEYDDDYYESSPTQSSTNSKVSATHGREEHSNVEQQSQMMHINTDHRYSVRVKQDSNEPREGNVLQSGQSLSGYTVPPGFRGRVMSMSGKDTVAQGDGKSQSQTVSLVPAESNNGPETKSPISETRSLQTTHEKMEHHLRKEKLMGTIARDQLPFTDQSKSSDVPISPSYYTVTNSVAGKMVGRNAPRKYEHRYYTKSSTCGYFTFSCNIVYGSNGRTKICKPKVPTYPDGTPMKC